MSNSGKKAAEEDEVEQLLRAAQDDVLLKLSINSHVARATAINPDLDRRFQALKKPQKLDDDSTTRVPPKMDTGAADDDDLSARFAALKNSLPSHSHTRKNEKKSDESEDVTEEEEDDEVEKVIKWAIDAARLDPSPPSDDDDDDSDDDDDGGKK
ncbi:hypothetical protein ACS0TY_011393 [Phlomoides rotata]